MTNRRRNLIMLQMLNLPQHIFFNDPEVFLINFEPFVSVVKADDGAFDIF